MALQLRPCVFCLPPSSRSYATATIVKTSQPKQKRSHKSARKLPPYPYGPSQWYKQRDSGLYGGGSILYGHSRTEKKAKKNDAVSSRTFSPNVQLKKIWSASLGQMVSVKVRMRTLRTIDKVGGLDNYLTGNKVARIKELGMTGWRLRWKILRTQNMVQRIEQERAALGLPREGFYAAESAAEKELRQRAIVVAEKYIQIIDTEEEREMAKLEDQAESNASQELYDEFEQAQEEDQRQLEEQDSDAQTSEAFEPILPHEGLDSRLNRLAIDVARDTSQASPTLPLPDLHDSLEPSISLLPPSVPVEMEQTLQQPEQYLYHQITQYADRLSTTTEDLLDAARVHISERETQLEAMQEKQRAALLRQSEIARAQREGNPVPRKDYHPEIDTAIAAGTSTLLPLYRFHLSQVQDNLNVLLAQRNEQRRKLANQFLRELKTKNAKGGRGVFIKRTAWDTCMRRAVAKMGHRPSLLSGKIVPEGMTQSQWVRLFEAGRLAEEEERLDILEARQREEEGGQGGAGGEKQDDEGVRGWMSEKELGMMDRIRDGVAGWRTRARAAVFG